MMMRGEEEEEGLDPSSLYSFDSGYENACKSICYPPSLPSPPLSPLWELPDHYPENTILTKLKDISIPQLPSSMPVNHPWQEFFLEIFTILPESSYRFSGNVKEFLTLFYRDVNDSISEVMCVKMSTFKSMAPASEAEENMNIHVRPIRSIMQNMRFSSSIIVTVITKKWSISSILQIDNGVIQVGPVTEVEQVTGFIQVDALSLNQQAMVLITEIRKDGVIAKLDSQERQTVVELDEIEGDIGSDVLGLTISEKRNISSSTYNTSENAISLEDLRQCFSMTREEAAKSFDISVSTLKRVCRKHRISRWPFRKRRKKYEAPSKPKIMKITEQETVTTRSSQTDLQI